MAKLYPYIYSEQAKKQAEFYVNALGGEIKSIRTFADMPGAPDAIRDRVMHLELAAAGLTFYMADQDDVPMERGNGMDLTLTYQAEDEAKRAFEGLAKGGVVIMPFERMFWGAVFGRVKDPFGVIWQISTEG
jgi:PhnB protein